MAAHSCTLACAVKGPPNSKHVCKVIPQLCHHAARNRSPCRNCGGLQRGVWIREEAAWHRAEQALHEGARGVMLSLQAPGHLAHRQRGLHPNQAAPSPLLTLHMQHLLLHCTLITVILACGNRHIMGSTARGPQPEAPEAPTRA